MGMGDAFLTTILQGFFFFLNNKNNYQLPLPSRQGLGAWRTRLPKGSCPLFGRCRDAGKDNPSRDGGSVKSALPPGMGCCLQPEWVSRVACLFWVLELWNYAR